MSGKDLLGVLAMVVPGFLLIALMAFMLGLSADMPTAPSAARIVHAGAGSAKTQEGHDASMRTKPRIATQKLMRDPWEKPAYAKSSRLSEPLACELVLGDQKATCFYW